MKKNYFIIILLMAGLLFTACEDVVDVGLPSSEPRLVVDASINWHKGDSGNWQLVKLTTSTNYYATEIPAVQGADVYIRSQSGSFYEFTEIGPDSPGFYACENFEPVIGETYTLHIGYDENYYSATETLMPVPDLQYAEQTDDGFLEGQQVIRAYFDDPPGIENYYMHGFFREDKGPQYAVFDDNFTDGNNTYTVRIFDNLRRGEIMTIRLFGISERYFDYMSKIFTTTSEGNIGPFQVAPAQLRGNIINETDPDNYAYGYFRLSEVSSLEYIVQ